ncbi:MAG: ABC transporter ATP-binding protein [Clostridia bacterium]|nr:ABC transporter ATP-binding protein [Clostridia bacterium]
MIFGKHINKYYLRYSWLLLLGVIALIAVDIYQLKVPELYGRLIDGLDPNTANIITKGNILDICYELLVIVVIMVVGRFLWRVGFFGSAIRVETDIRREMFDRCKDFSQQYYQVNKVGNLMSLFTNDLETINECFGDGTLMFFDALILGLMAVYKMYRLSPMLTLLALIPMVLLCAIGAIVGKAMQKKWEERQESFSRLSDYAQESFSGIAVIKAFVKELKELLEFRKLNKHNEKVNVAFTKVSVWLEVLVTLFVQSVICVILGYGGWLAYTGRFSVAQLIMFISYFNSIVWPVMAISYLIEMSSRGKASLGRISELLETRCDVVDRADVRDVDSIRGDIEFRGLTFSYPDEEREVLRDVSFSIKAGENVGIIGRTGSGKSTIVDLILRTYNVPDGTLFIDGHDVNTIPIKTVRDYCAYVPQDNFLFSDTIGRNIAFAFGGEADAESIERASNIAALSDNVEEFVDKYDTMLGERGVTISGGQKQRTSIARAVMKDAAILILDDSVSAVDTGTEKQIIGNLRSERVGKTTILIAHRVSTIEHMDKIIFIDDGEIVDVGKHDELCERCEAYRRTVEMQRLEDEIGGMNS